jgi:phosphoacetylglucosamine mutase
LAFAIEFILLVRCLIDLIPSGSKISEVDEKLVVDGANGVGGGKLEVLREMLDGMVFEIRNSGKDGGVLNEGVGADYVQKEKFAPHGFGSQDVGLRSAISSLFDSK